MRSIGQFLMGEKITEPKKFKDSAASMFNFKDVGRNDGLDIYNIDDALMPKLNKGSNGFQDFGSGTPAMLHGKEAVVPKNDIGQLVGLLAEVGATTSTNATAGETVTNNTTTDMTALNVNTEKLIALTEKTANHLNMLVTIGAMTEKNTKSTNNSLANMGGSLV